MKYKKHPLSLALSFLLFSCYGYNFNPAFAQNESPKKENYNALEKNLIQKNISFSERIDRLAVRLDKYLAGKKLSKEKNTTTLIVENSFIANEHSDKDVQYQPHLAIELHLPHLEEKWSLRFTSYDELEEEEGIAARRIRTDEKKESYGAGARFLQKIGDINVEFKPRVQANKVSHTFTFSSSARFNSFLFTPKLRLFGQSKTGTGQFLGLNLSYLFNDFTALTLVNEEQYRDHINQTSTNHGLRLGHSFSDTLRGGAALIYEFESRPRNFHLTQYVFSLPFEKVIYKRVLVSSLVPYIAYQHSPEYDVVHGANLNLSIIF